MSDLSGAKVGDILCVIRHQAPWLHKVTSVTKSGRVRTQHMEFNKDGTQRGEHRYDSATARLATPEDLQAVLRRHLTDKLIRHKWSDVSDETIKKVAQMVGISIPVLKNVYLGGF